MSAKSCLLIGRKPLLEALEEGQVLERIYLQNTIQTDFLYKVRKLAMALEIPIRLVPLVKLNKLTKAKHQGVVALRTVAEYYAVQDLIDSDLLHGEVPLFLILTDITDVRNIGAILRTAYASKVSAVILVNTKGSMALGEDALKSSAGALLKVRLGRASNLSKVLEILILNGIKPFFTTVDKLNINSIAPYSADLAQPLALVIGGESKGIVGNYTGTYLHIPMAENFDSLNVSVATGILLYEVRRQRDVLKKKMNNFN